jgi:hypothetical protein
MPYTVTILTHNDYFKDQFTTTETRVFQTKEDAYKLAALRYMDEIHDWDDFTEDDALLLLQGKAKEFVDLMENHSHFDGEYIPRRIEISVWGKAIETETLEGKDLEAYEKALKELTEGYFPDGLPEEGAEEEEEEVKAPSPRDFEVPLPRSSYDPFKYAKNSDIYRLNELLKKHKWLWLEPALPEGSEYPPKYLDNRWDSLSEAKKIQKFSKSTKIDDELFKNMVLKYAPDGISWDKLRDRLKNPKL